MNNEAHNCNIRQLYPIWDKRSRNIAVTTTPITVGNTIWRPNFIY